MNHQTDQDVDPPHVLLCGFPGTIARGFLGWGSIVLVRHLGHIILFDTGGPGDRVGLLRSLEEQTVQPQDVDMIVLSHLHFDHALNVELFPNADIYLHRSELDYAKNLVGRDLALCGWAVDAISCHPRLKLLDGEPELLAGIQVMHTPGHTAGSISLSMSVGGERWVLAQDAVKNRKELASGRVEMAADHDSAQRSVARIRSVAQIVLPGHDALLRVQGDRITPLGEASVEVIEVLGGERLLLRAGERPS